MRTVFRRFGAAGGAAAILLLTAVCDSGPDRNVPDNPLDPRNPATGGDPFSLRAVYENGSVRVSWNEPDLPGIGGYVVFRRTEFESLYARIDTTGVGAGSWTDGEPIHFARAWYRIAAYGPGGVETDTAGRAPDSVNVPPLLEIAGGAATTALRTVSVRLAAERAEEMMLSEDSLFQGVDWEPFDTLRSWTLPEEPGIKTLYLLVRRGGGTVSDTVSASISPASTNGQIKLAGGDSTIARVLVDVEVRAKLPTRIVLSEDSLFGDAEDVVFLYDGTENVQPLETTWTFDDEPFVKTILVEIANEFEAETLRASVDPDLLEDAAVRFSWDDSVSSECAVPVVLEGNAVLARLASTMDELLDATWTAFTEDTVWTIGPTEGEYEIWAQLKNDFTTRWLFDRISFLPAPLAILITDPADSSEYRGGDTLTLSGETVAASCREDPDSITVAAPDTVFTVPNSESGWTALWPVGDSPAETTLATIVVSCTDGADTTAVDTIFILLLPEAE